MKLTKAQKGALKELNYCIEHCGEPPKIPFHKNWGPTVFEFLPSVNFAGWGDFYDGGTIYYRGRKGFLGPEEIKNALWLVYKLQRPLKKEEIYKLSTRVLSGASGRLAELGFL